jgi:hypothetical protein
VQRKNERISLRILRDCIECVMLLDLWGGRRQKGIVASGTPGYTPAPFSVPLRIDVTQSLETESGAFRMGLAALPFRFARHAGACHARID